MSELTRLTLVEAREGLSARRFSSVELTQAFLAAIERLGVQPPASYEKIIGHDPLLVMREALGEQAYGDAIERGKRMSLDDAVDLIDAAGRDTL